MALPLDHAHALPALTHPHLTPTPSYLPIPPQISSLAGVGERLAVLRAERARLEAQEEEAMIAEVEVEELRAVKEAQAAAREREEEVGVVTTLLCLGRARMCAARLSPWGWNGPMHAPCLFCGSFDGVAPHCC